MASITNITPEQMVAHWANWRPRYDMAINNFLVKATSFFEYHFKGAITDGSWNGKSYPQRSSDWMRRIRKKYGGVYPILRETETMKNSIKNKKNSNRTSVIYTDPRAYCTSRRNPRNRCYAAVHNEGLPLAHGGNMPKRQFMGNNSHWELEARQILVNELAQVFPGLHGAFSEVSWGIGFKR